MAVIFICEKPPSSINQQAKQEHCNGDILIVLSGQNARQAWANYNLLILEISHSLLVLYEFKITGNQISENSYTNFLLVSTSMKSM